MSVAELEALPTINRLSFGSSTALDQVFADPQVAASGIVADVKGPEGETRRILNQVAVLERTPARLEKLLELLEHEVDILQVEKRIRGRVKRQMEKSQREYYLNEQVKAIQKELGDGEEGADLEELEKKIEAAKMSKEARKKADSELKKLKLMSPMSAEATVVRNYLDWLLSLPWGKKSKVKKDIAASQAQVLAQRMTLVERPPYSPPSYLRAAILRGLAFTREDRFASMDELLAVLIDGKRRRRQRGLLLAGLGLTAVVGSTAGALCTSAAAGRCVADCCHCQPSTPAVTTSRPSTV